MLDTMMVMMMMMMLELKKGNMMVVHTMNNLVLKLALEQELVLISFVFALYKTALLVMFILMLLHMDHNQLHHKGNDSQPEIDCRIESCTFNKKHANKTENKESIMSRSNHNTKSRRRERARYHITSTRLFN